MLLVLVFNYIPIVLQSIMSLIHFNLRDGLFGSDFVGLQNYIDLFSPVNNVGRLVRNTIEISLLRMAFGFFPPLILAIILFDLRSVKYRKIAQTIVYIPYFFSWVIVYGISYGLFSAEGLLSSIIQAFGGEGKNYLMFAQYIRPILVSTSLWKNVGWGTIIYLAALTSIDGQLYDSAKIDGCGPLQRIWHITLPGIRHIIIFLLMLNIGNLLRNVDAEQILLFYNPATYSKADVIDTWLYRIGLKEFEYGLGTALAFLQSTLGLIMILTANYISRKKFKVSLW